MERDSPELPRIVIVMSGATRALQRAMNLQQYNGTDRYQGQMLQHCLVRL